MNVEKRKVQLQERQQLIDLGKWGVDSVVKLASNPAFTLVGGFILTNMAENTVIGKTSVDDTTIDYNWWNVVFPQWSIFFPDKETHTIPAGSPVTLLTKDQANVARAALVALASSGLVGSLTGLLKGVQNG